MAGDEDGVSRKVYFFRLEHFNQLKDCLPGALERIANLPFEDHGRYQRDVSSDSRLSGFPDRFEYPLRFRFSRTRRNSLPDIERAGRLEALELDEDAGLIDVCHVVFFQDGFVASEFNHDGPRISKLGHYLFEKGGNLPILPAFRALFERDIVDVVSRLDRVRVIEIDVPPDTAELIDEADRSLADAIRASAKAGATKKVALTLSAELGTKKLHSISQRLAGLIKARPSERKAFRALKVIGYQPNSSVAKYIDILEERLVSGEIFPRNSVRSRSINSDEAYRLIENAYESRKDKLQSAAVGPERW